MRHVLLYDFAIHWFDLICGIFSDRPPTWVSATHARVPDQTLSPPMLGHALIRFEDGLATLHLDGHSRFGPEESWVVTGSRGTLVACGGVCAAHDLRLFTKKGIACPKLEGQWFDDGFRGAMGELLCAIESHRQPSNSAVSALRSLALCFAAMKAADTLNPQTPGKVRRAPAG
jgi:predicted dehydrogenase